MIGGVDVNCSPFGTDVSCYSTGGYMSRAPMYVPRFTCLLTREVNQRGSFPRLETAPYFNGLEGYPFLDDQRWP